MKKEQVLDLMNAIEPDLIEEADLQSPVKRRMPKAARAGLIAACLCLALLGTAMAAQYFGVQIVEEDGGHIYLQGGIAYYPYDSLSDELKALEGVQETASGTLIRTVPSWQAAEDFIGVNLMDNPVLDASPATQCGHTFEGVDSCFMAVISRDFSSIQVYGCYELGEADILVETTLFTDRRAALPEDWDEQFHGYGFTEDTQVSRDAYTAPSGLTAQLLEIVYPDNGETVCDPACKAVFSLSGIPTIVTASAEDGPTARSALIQTLDGFILPE